MDMVLHHQKRRKFSDGTFVNIGEDGCPYADGGLLIVADGLGGRGGFPHTKINPDILDGDNFYSRFIAPVLGAADENFAAFVTRSFKELFQLKDRYFTDTSSMRTSGYFASRIVTAIVLHAFKFRPEFNRDVIFSNLLSLDGDGQKQYLDALRASLAALISDQLARIAEGMGLQLESKTKGSYLLPTTLIVALIRQTESGADVLYLWAGDSRGYVWNGDGLAQITADHERDETMTNLVSLTRPFHIEARLLSVEKPAILFNSTDGCYKCPCFASPFDLEYIFLQAIISSDNFEGAANILDGQFVSIGTHDDSNTMALTTVGFDSYDAVKAAVSRRLDYIQEHIIKELPDILERDYEEELNDIEDKIEGDIFALKDELIKDERIKEYVKKRMVSENYAPYVNDLARLKKRLEELDGEEGKIREKIINWVRGNWLLGPCLKKYSPAGDYLFRGDSYERFARTEELCRGEEQRYTETYTKLLNDLVESVSALDGMREKILSIETIYNRDTQRELSLKINVIQNLLFNMTNDLVRGRAGKDFYRYSTAARELIDAARGYARQDHEQITALADAIIKGRFNLDGVPIPKESRDEIASCLAALSDVTKAKDETLAEINNLCDKHYAGYWNLRLRDHVNDLFREHSELIPEEIRLQLVNKRGALQAEREETERLLQIRNGLYDTYAKTYYRYYKESEL